MLEDLANAPRLGDEGEIARLSLDELDWRAGTLTLRHNRGRREDLLPQPDLTYFPNIERLRELMIVGPITVRGACSRQLCPIIGKLWIGVMPQEHSNLIGLSKDARLADWVMSRPQIRESAV
jgi:GTP cyclohydrolase I